MTNLPKKKQNQRSLLQRYAAAPHITWAVLFILAPLLFVAYYAFTNGDGGFTLQNVGNFFTPTYLKIFFRSLKLAIIATVICLLIGYPIAYFISRCKPKTQRILVLLLMLPMWMNFLIRTYAIMVLIQNTGIINSFLGSFKIAWRTLKEGRKYKFYKCPQCAVVLRLPKGAGVIEITCPKCGKKFIKKV